MIQNNTLTHSKEQPLSLPWLTGEVMVYILLAVLALTLRLTALQAHPLNNAEASQALAALDIYQGRSVTIKAYSPLLASLTGVAFVLFGPSDGAARLPAALLGVILVALPFALRRQWGRLPALATSALLTISASTLFWSRLSSGEIAVAVGMMLLLVGGAQWFFEAKDKGLYFAATGLVFVLLGAPSGYTALAVLLLLVLVVGFASRHSWPAIREKLAAAGNAAKQAALLFVGLLILLGTAGLFNISGLAAISNMFTAWLSQFGLQMQPGAGYPAIFTLFFYEPLILLFGLTGVVAALWNRHPLDWALAAWTAIFLIIDLLMGGRSGGQVLLAVLPLTLLAGRRIGLLWTQWATEARPDREGLFLVIGLVVSVFSYISLTSWSRCEPAQAGCSTAWILPLAGALLLLGLAIVFWVWYGPQVAGRGLGLLLMMVIGLLSLGAAWRLNFNPLSTLPYQPLVQLPASTRLPGMIDQIKRLSVEQTGGFHQIDIAVVELDEPILRWYLRRFEQTHYETDFLFANEASLILARPDAGQPLEGAYVGQEFALVSYWAPNQLQGKDWLRWYIYRYLPTHIPGSDQVVLWVKMN